MPRWLVRATSHGGRLDVNTRDARLREAKRLMLHFADATGLVGEAAPRRYLWTDAHAVCNLLSLFKWEHDARWVELARLLVDQVHQVLGKHRADDARTGWISGLSEAEGLAHPTMGGLRIGKPRPERRADAPFDERAEWEQDGQYYHYLTKWMHALGQLGTATGDDRYPLWAMELAVAAHTGFRSGAGPDRLYWKMSTDLSYPLLTASGQHDPLDGLVTALVLRERTAASNAGRLEPVIEDLARLCRGRVWTTDDPLGIGGLLFDAARIAQLQPGADGALRLALLETVLTALEQSLRAYSASGALMLPAARRLAFRELGLSIGLQGIELMHRCALPVSMVRRLHALRPFERLREPIETLWLQWDRRVGTWLEHDDINSVMLATSLAPEGFLKIAT